jgi:hypothetical protein
VTGQELIEKYKEGVRDFSGVDLEGAYLEGAHLEGAHLEGAHLEGANLKGAHLEGAHLEGAILPDLKCKYSATDLRLAVADLIEYLDEFQGQVDWGNLHECGTPCRVAGWTCWLNETDGGLGIPTAAYLLLWVDGKEMPSFDPDAKKEDILKALRS